MERVLEYLGDKYQVPDGWPYADARELFLKPEVAEPDTLDYKWEAPDIDGLVGFLVTEKGFNEDRVRNGAARLSKGLKTSTQGAIAVASPPPRADGPEADFGETSAPERLFQAGAQDGRRVGGAEAQERAEGGRQEAQGQSGRRREEGWQEA